MSVHMKEFQPFRFEKESIHVLSRINFRTVVGDYVFYDAAGRPEASLYSYAYIAQPEQADRPVLFGYNGGPGAASSWVHMGLLGPKQVTFPNYPEDENGVPVYGENKNFLLDCCDLVLIDPPGTGYAFVRDDVQKKYFNTAGDAQAVSDFVVAWLREHGRQNAPVYLLGESYGTIRNLAVADRLIDKVQLAGIISIGTSFNVGSPTTMLVEPNVRRLGANAACCWYHLHQGEMPQRQFVQEAMDFAYGKYAHALLLGSRLPAEEFEQVLEKLHRYTGLDRDILRKGGLRFDEMTYLTKMLPGRLVSAYDSRMTRTLKGDMTEEEWNREIFSEPFFAFADGAISDALARYTEMDISRPEGRETGENILQIALDWDYAAMEKDTLTLPTELMERSSALRFFFVAGYYDLQSTFDFVAYFLGRYALPAERVKFCVYDTGHAAYVGGDAAEKVCGDIRCFITGQK